MHLFETLLILLAACAGLAILAGRLRVPYAVLLVLAGMALAMVPGLPAIELEPHLALALFLPPFLQLSAYRTDWPAFRGALRPILLLAVGAVLFTAAAVGATAKWLIPELPWAAAIALGAIVAPPDAVAAAAVLKEVRVPKRIVTVLEGESLLNDASSLVLYRFAVAAVAAGTVEWGSAVGSFLLNAAGGTAVGWALGHIALWAFRRMENSLLETTLSILTGYAAFLLSEQLHVSGVLGAVASGLVIGRNQHRVFSARVRLESTSVWNFLEFLLTSFVFILIGLQLRGLVERLAAYALLDLLGLAAAVAGALVASRFVWVFATGYLTRAVRSGRGKSMEPANHMGVISWAGMRGVVSLAAALSLPADFPFRDIIVFLAFSAIFATLVFQGTTLGWVIRRLRATAPEAQGIEEDEARVRRKLAAVELDAVLDRLREPDTREVARALLPEFRQRALALSRLTREEGAHELRDARLNIRLDAVHAARRRLAEHQGELDAERLRVIEEELDHREAQLRRALGEAD